MAATPEGNALTKEEQDRMCRGKKRFGKEGQAINEVVRRRLRGAREHMRVYGCPVCAGHHIATGLLARREARLAG